VVDVFAFDRKPAAGHDSRGGKLVVEEGARVEQADAELLDLGGNRSEDRLGIAPLEGKEDAGRLDVGMETLNRRRGVIWPAMNA